MQQMQMAHMSGSHEQVMKAQSGLADVVQVSC